MVGSPRCVDTFSTRSSAAPASAAPANNAAATIGPRMSDSKLKVGNSLRELRPCLLPEGIAPGRRWLVSLAERVTYLEDAVDRPTDEPNGRTGNFSSSRLMPVQPTVTVITQDIL